MPFIVICVIILAVLIAFLVYTSKIMNAIARNKKNTYKVFEENGCTVTYKFADMIIDENKKCWAVLGFSHVFNYDDITDYEYFENGNSYRRDSMMTRALTNSVASQQINSMYVTIYTKVPNYPKVSVQLISSPISTNSMTYRLNRSNAETLIGRLKQMMPDNSPNTATTATSAADEIAKYKSLLDSGAITQEEYDKKKSELLNI